MTRRLIGLLITLTLGLLVAPCAAEAPPRNIPVIGVLANTDLSAALADPKSSVAAFRQGLRDIGYVEGQNINLEYRPLGGKQALRSSFAAELVRLKVDVLVTFGLIPTRASVTASGSSTTKVACCTK